MVPLHGDQMEIHAIYMDDDPTIVDLHLDLTVGSADTMLVPHWMFAEAPHLTIIMVDDEHDLRLTYLVHESNLQVPDRVRGLAVYMHCDGCSCYTRCDSVKQQGSMQTHCRRCDDAQTGLHAMDCIPFWLVMFAGFSTIQVMLGFACVSCFRMTYVGNPNPLLRSIS